MTLSGTYVKTFAEASHALPQGMHMNADYPLMLAPIISVTHGDVTLRDSRGVDHVARIYCGGTGQFCEISQSSSFETMMGKRPHSFKFFPFLDEKSKPIGVSDV